jgi:molecular chaperone GrpE
MTPEPETDTPAIPVEVEPPAKPAADQAQADAPVRPPPSPSEPSPPSPTKELEDKLLAADKDKKDLHERLLRTAADFDNFRKRSRKDVDDARHKAREEVLREILPVIDNLERALQAAGQGPATGGQAGIAEGVKLVLRQAASSLERFEVKAFPSVGEAFDPARHEAIAQVETSDHPAGTVVTEMQKGYLLGARLLRAALVAVARPPQPAAAPPAEAEAAPAPPPESPPQPDGEPSS